MYSRIRIRLQLGTLIDFYFWPTFYMHQPSTSKSLISLVSEVKSMRAIWTGVTPRGDHSNPAKFSSFITARFNYEHIMIRAEARIPRVMDIQVLAVQQFVPLLSANLFLVQSRPSRALEPPRAHLPESLVLYRSLKDTVVSIRKMYQSAVKMRISYV